MVRSSDLFQQWRLADQEAVRVERLLRSANLAYAAGEGPFPSAALMAECRQRRHLANLLLLQALATAHQELAAQQADWRGGNRVASAAPAAGPSSTPASSDANKGVPPANTSWGA